ncbi:Aste57867_1626 [Aphanomyces stellatus]|uniref:Aste57867_1626 protein n=1 Tax=Aphanomyces stellatus TaxID=120398 RepID=A0A485K6Q2_9STRA|nr:hypothetical protein As57867_001624 [Aphanomyces stellatus]VFT78839.1 Aste57867_1626 [Aphanomyces stellatus]
MTWSRPQARFIVTCVLFLTSCAFLLCVTIALSGTLSRAKWTDLFEVVSGFSSMTFLVFSIVCAAAAVLVSCVKTLLPPPNQWHIIFALTFVIFAGVVAAMGIRSASAASSWSSSVFPSSPDEAAIAQGFNFAMCSIRLCESSPARLSDFFPTIFQNATSAPLPAAFAAAETMHIACALLTNNHTAIRDGIVPFNVAAACTHCPEVLPLAKSHSRDLDWMRRSCDLNRDTDAFCGQASSSATTLDAAAPYEKCRSPLLATWRQYAKDVTAGSIAMAVAGLLYICMASSRIKTSVAVARRLESPHAAAKSAPTVATDQEAYHAVV